MRVQLRHEPLTVLADDPRGFDACFVVLKAGLRRQAGHADVITRLPVAFWIGQIDDVHRMMALSFRTCHRSNIRRESTVLARHEIVDSGGGVLCDYV
jgi:hypothetical protein